MSADPLWPLRVKVALGCRILGARGLVDGVLGHVSARVGPRLAAGAVPGPARAGRGPHRPDDIRLVDLDGNHLEASDGWQVPKELPIHTRRAGDPAGRRRRGARPPAARCSWRAWPGYRCGRSSAPTTSRPCAWPLDGVPVYEPIGAHQPGRAGRRDAGGHGRATGCASCGATASPSPATSVEQAVVPRRRPRRAVPRHGASWPALGVDGARRARARPAELPDLGSAFNDQLHWRALVAELPALS